MLEAHRRIGQYWIMETIHQTVIIDCPAHAVYDAFTDAGLHADITHADAEIDPQAGGIYSAYGGELTGEFSTLIPDRQIVMQWRSAMDGWPEDHYAVVNMEFFQSSDGTTIDFTLTDVPGEVAEAIEEGWYEFYWEPMQRALNI